MMSTTGSDNTLTVKIGGRLVSPALSVVDGRPSTNPIELSFNNSLHNFIKDNIQLESTDGIQTRERALSRIGVMCREWIKSICRKRGLPKDVVDSAGGQLFTSGSYRLGIHEQGADIDALLVYPSICTREDIFGTVDDSEESDNTKSRKDDSLSYRIRNHPDVTNFVPVENAAVPILTFDWEGVNFDLLFARLNSASVPPDFDIDNDVILDGMDMTASRPVNGPRVTNMIAALVSGTKERYKTFLTVVRCVRKWAKARGLYSNKMGYWGGININIAVAFCVQLYPNTCPASLLRKFFLVFKTWRWPKAIMLTKTHDAGYGMPVWTVSPQTAKQVAPMLTPTYPATNSTFSVSRQTLQIFHEEFCRGYEIVDNLWKQHQSNKNSDPEGLDWKELFRPSDFFIAYPYYLSLCIVGPSQNDEQMWSGFVESRLRRLVSDMLGKSLPLSKIQLWPKKIEACIADRSALLTMEQRRNSVTFMVGFRVDKLRMRGSQLNIELQMQHFRDWELSKFQPLTPGMDIMTKTFTCKTLPTICFDMYEGGKVGAMKRRRNLRNDDPLRQERRRQKRLADLKAKVAEIQTRKKRKRSGSEENADEGVSMKDGDTSSPNVVTNNSNSSNNNNNNGSDENGENDVEENLLEDAWDTLQEDETGERKTREDAEADRKKLLSGELLVEGADAPSDDEDELDYTGEDGDGRRTFVVNNSKLKPIKEQRKMYKDIHALPMREEEAELLRKAGYTIVSDAETESKIVGGNMPNPFRSRNHVSVNDGDGDGDGDSDDSKEDPDEKKTTITANTKAKIKVNIKLRTKFDVVELDAAGFVIDKGDEDFTPSKMWIGRKAGFEFKKGERGLGYYRTGKKTSGPQYRLY